MSVDAQWTYRGLQALLMENRRLRVTVLPQIGGRIWSIIDKQHDRELLWHNPRIAPRQVPFGAVYDDVWCGGWEEIAPNDAPGSIGGEAYPDHGETWAAEWNWQDEAGDLVLRYDGAISGLRYEKHLRLEPEGAALQVDFVVENPTGSALSVLFKLHAALAVRPGMELRLPAGSQVELEPAVPGSPASPVMPPPAPGQLHFFYAHSYSEGRCRVVDRENSVAYGLDFDPAVFRSCWIFASYGGWRNYYVAVVEPATGHPFQIERAVERGLALDLAPGAALRTGVTFRVES